MASAIAARLQPADAKKKVPAGALTMAQYRPESYRLVPGAETARQEALASLMQSLLLKRFESCWYAALQTVRRMRRKAAARIRYMEAAGGDEPLPDDEEDLGEVDAAAAELMEEPGDWANPDGFRPDLLVDLQRDVAILDELAGQIAALEGEADPKLEALREVMATTEADKVVIFTSFRDTAEYLQRAFEADAGLLDGREWAAVVGAETSDAARESAIDRFCRTWRSCLVSPRRRTGRSMCCSVPTCCPRARTSNRHRRCFRTTCPGTRNGLCSATAA